MSSEGGQCQERTCHEFIFTLGFAKVSPEITANQVFDFIIGVGLVSFFV